MNMPNLNTPPAPEARPRPEAAAKPQQRQGAKGPQERDRGEEFARLLQAKAAARSDPGAKVELETSSLIGPAQPDPLAFAAALPLRRIETELESDLASQDAAAVGAAPPCKPAGNAAPIQNFSPTSADQGNSASRAAIEAALKGDAAQPVTAAGGAETAWEATVREPRGVAVELRATRTAPAAGETQAAWRLTLASPAMEATLLARHASRLAERLRTRAVDHVRVETEDARE
jgi:hypothetical protein